MTLLPRHSSKDSPVKDRGHVKQLISCEVTQSRCVAPVDGLDIAAVPLATLFDSIEITTQMLYNY